MTEATFGQIWWQILLALLISYLCGNINFAIIISKLKKTDIRTQGSGNPGTMNMVRSFGIKIGILTLFLDAMKAFLPTLGAGLYFSGLQTPDGYCWGALVPVVCGLAAVIGHIYPVALKFHGGKGVASTIGVFLYLQPIATAVMLVVGFFYILKYEYGSVASLMVITVVTLADAVCELIFVLQQGFYVESLAVWICLFVICALTYYAHRGNLRRLRAGTENRTKLREMMAGKKKAKEEAAAAAEPDQPEKPGDAGTSQDPGTEDPADPR